MKEITESEFWDVVRALDVHPTPVGRFPYTSVFKTRNGVEIGRKVPTNERKEGLLQYRFYLA